MASRELAATVGDITTCSLCSDAFSDPKILPTCVHTFCCDCLERYFSDKETGARETCPLCRKEFEIPNGGAAKLQTNLVVEKLLENQKLSGQLPTNRRMQLEGILKLLTTNRRQFQ